MTFTARIAMALIGLVTQSCLAWILGPGGRGSYAVCLLFATLLGVCIVVGYDLPSLYFVASKQFTVSEGITHALVYGAAGSVLAVGVGLAMMHMPLAFLQKASPRTFYLALVFLPIGLYTFTFLQLLTSVREFGWYALLQTVNSLTMLLGTLAFVWGLSWGPEGALLANITAGLVTTAAVLVVFRRKYGAKLVRPSWEKLRMMFRYGARYYVGKISNLVNFQMGTILLALFATREEVGLFAVAALLTGRTMLVPHTLTGLLVPKVARDQAGTTDLVAVCARLTFVICGGLLLVLSLFAKPIVSLLFSSAFLPVVPLIWILAAGFLIRGPANVFIAYLLGADRPGATSFAMAGGMIVNFGVLWVLLPILRLPGAAVALAASYLVSTIIVVLFFCRSSGLSLGQIFRFRRSDWDLLLGPIRRVWARWTSRAAPAREPASEEPDPTTGPRP